MVQGGEGEHSHAGTPGDIPGTLFPPSMTFKVKTPFFSKSQPWADSWRLRKAHSGSEQHLPTATTLKGRMALISCRSSDPKEVMPRCSKAKPELLDTGLKQTAGMGEKRGARASEQGHTETRVLHTPSITPARPQGGPALRHLGSQYGQCWLKTFKVRYGDGHSQGPLNVRKIIL